MSVGFCIEASLMDAWQGCNYASIGASGSFIHFQRFSPRSALAVQGVLLMN